MTMVWFVALAIVVVAGAVAAMAAGFGTMAGAEPTAAPFPSDRELRPGDLLGARFSTAARGYRPDEVDALLARAAQQWEREREVR